MTKADLIDEVSRLAELTRKDSEVIVETIFDSVVRSLRAGGKIEIRGFGSFRTRQRQPTSGEDPTDWRWAGDWEEEADARSIARAYPRRWPPGDAATARGRTTPVPICPQQTYSKHDSLHSPSGRQRWARSCGA